MLIAILVTGLCGSLVYLALMRQPRHLSSPASLGDILRNASAMHRLGHTQRALQVLLDARAVCDDRVMLEVRILEYQEYLDAVRGASGLPAMGRRGAMKPAFLLLE